MAVFHPDTTTVFLTETEYTYVPAPQPSVVAELEVETTYVPPASSGGQPDVVSTMTLTTELGWLLPTVDTTGSTRITFETSAVPSLKHGVTPIPTGLDFHDVDIVQVSMPKPTSYDQFGRPTG